MFCALLTPLLLLQLHCCCLIVASTGSTVEKGGYQLIGSVTCVWAVLWAWPSLKLKVTEVWTKFRPNLQAGPEPSLE